MSDTQPSSLPQSQDHLDRHAGHEEAAATAQASPTSVEPVQPQDPHAAGAASDQQSAVLQKNVSGSEQQGAAERAKQLEEQAGGTAGYHSTGSSTKTSGGQ